MKIEKEILNILEPLTSVDGLESIAIDLGIVSSGFDDLIPPQLLDLINNSNTFVLSIKAIVDEADGDDEVKVNIIELLNLARNIFNLIKNIQDTAELVETGDFLHPFDTPEFWEDLGKKTPGYLLFRWVRDYHPLAFTIIDFLSLWKTGPQNYGIDLEQISLYLSEPADSLADLVTEDDAITLEPIFYLIQEISYMFGLVKPQRSVLYIEGQNYEITDLPDPKYGGITTSFSPPGVGVDGSIDISLAAEGDAVEIGLEMEGQAELDYTLSEDWSIKAGLSGEADLAFRFSIADGISFSNEDAPSTSGAVSLNGVPEEPWRIIGVGTGPNLGLAGLSLKTEVKLEGLEPEFTASLNFEGLKLTVNPADGDSFIADAIPLEEFSLDFDFGVNWSSISGVSITSDGPSGLSIPLNINLGPIKIHKLDIGIGANEDGGIDLTISTSGAVDIVVLRASIENIGMIANISSNSDGLGALGDMDFGVRFKPPTGLGLEIGKKGSPIYGGGYLNIDPEAGRYEGVVALQVVKVGISAVVIIDTKALDSGEWSMFFALFIELPSIPLGFGITLEGVGGVAGINRTMDAEAILAAARSGAIDTILFPENPIEDAPIIIDTFRSMFPPAQGRYVFGPVIKVAWGKGTVTGELGVVIELPDPIMVAILGSLSVVLPNAKPPADTSAIEVVEGEETEQVKSLINLHLDVAGIFDFEAGTMAIDAALHDSTIAGFAIDGGMSLRAAFKNEPSFIMALGGFHPGFPEPVGFPNVPRLAMGIDISEVIHISFECYFAITSNTVQFGAQIHLLADIEVFQIEGGFEFDALFYFDPFHVTIELDMYVSVRALGMDLLSVRVSGTVDGPGPWNITALAEVNIIGYRDGFEINYTNGETAQQAVLAPPSLLNKLEEALLASDVWQVEAALASNVLMAEPSSSGAQFRVLPNAKISISQKIIPLEAEIGRYGQNQNIEHMRFTLATDANSFESDGVVEDWFAPGQFNDLGAGDQAKLSAPSFEKMASGLSFGSGIRVSAAKQVNLSHKVVTIDPDIGVIDADLNGTESYDDTNYRENEQLSDVISSEWVEVSTLADIEAVEVNVVEFISVDISTGIPLTSGASGYSTASSAISANVAIVRDFEMRAE